MLKRLRKEKGLTQLELAQRAGCARITIQRIETGQNEPTLDLAVRIMEALGMKPVPGQLRLIFPTLKIPDNKGGTDPDEPTN